MNRFTNFLADYSSTILVASAAAIVLSCATPAQAKCITNDNWRGPDKVLHGQGGAVLGFIGTMYTGNPWHGIALATAAGVGKELMDSDGSGQCSLQDALVTIAGGAVGSAIGRGVYIYFDPRAKSVQVGINITLGN